MISSAVDASLPTPSPSSSSFAFLSVREVSLPSPNSSSVAIYIHVVARQVGGRVYLYHVGLRFVDIKVE